MGKARRRSKDPASLRSSPSAAFEAELVDRAHRLKDHDLKVWLRDVRPVVRRVAKQEMVRRGLHPENDTMSV